MGKTRGMGAARKLKNHRRAQRWADKAYRKKPFPGSSLLRMPKALSWRKCVSLLALFKENKGKA